MTERRAEQIRLAGIIQNDNVKGQRDRQVNADIWLLLITRVKRDSRCKVTTTLSVQSERLLLGLDSNSLKRGYRHSARLSTSQGYFHSSVLIKCSNYCRIQS